MPMFTNRLFFYLLTKKIAMEDEKSLIGNLGNVELVHKIELPTGQLLGIGGGLLFLIVTSFALKAILKNQA